MPDSLSPCHLLDINKTSSRRLQTEWVLVSVDRQISNHASVWWVVKNLEKVIFMDLSVSFIIFFCSICSLALHAKCPTIMNTQLVHYMSVFSLLWSIYLSSCYIKEWHWKWNVWNVVYWLLSNVQIVWVFRWLLKWSLMIGIWDLCPTNSSVKMTEGKERDERAAVSFIIFYSLKIQFVSLNFTVRSHQLKLWDLSTLFRTNGIAS